MICPKICQSLKKMSYTVHDIRKDICNRLGTEPPVNACEQKIYPGVFTPLSRNTTVSDHPQIASDNITTSTKKEAAYTHLRNKKHVPISGYYRLVARRKKPRVATSARGTKCDMLIHVAHVAKTCACLRFSSAFLKLWSADHKWSSGSALVVLLD